MIRRFTFLAFALAVLVGLANEARALSLRPQVTVSGATIRLGDLFHGLAEKANQDVAPAPTPGRRAVFDAVWLAAVARAHQLPWRPHSVYEKVVVERASRTLSRNDLETALRAAFTREQNIAPETMEIELDNPTIRLFVPAEAQGPIEVKSLHHDQMDNRFEALLTLPAAEGAEPHQKESVQISGRLYRLVDVPVPARRLRAGEVISSRDLTWVPVREDRLGRQAIMDMERMVGLTPRRMVEEGRPVRQGDLIEPVVVSRNTLVIIEIRTANMYLTAQGKALEDGTAGEVIRVMNTRSRQIVDSEVIGPDRVAVMLPNFANLAAR